MIPFIRSHGLAIVVSIAGAMSLFAPVSFGQVPLAEYRQLEDRVRIFERLLASEGLIRLHDDLKKLGQELRQLRGVVEVDNRAIESTKNSQIKQYQSLDRQLQQLGEGIGQLKESFRVLQAKVQVLESARGEVLERLKASLESAPRPSSPPALPVADSVVSDTAGVADAIAGDTAVVESLPVIMQRPVSRRPVATDPADALASSAETTTQAAAVSDVPPAAVDADSAEAATPSTLAATATPSIATTPITTPLGTPASTDETSVFDDLLSEQQAYRVAFELLKNGHYGRATRGFRDFISQYPASELAGNAQYWLGESLYVERDFVPAIEEFKQVLEQYPESPKLTHAMLKIGFIYDELGQLEEARRVLTEIIRSYPDSTAASLALRRLKRLAEQ